MTKQIGITASRTADQAAERLSEQAWDNIGIPKTQRPEISINAPTAAQVLGHEAVTGQLPAGQRQEVESPKVTK